MKEVMLRVKSGYLDNLILGLFLIGGLLGLFSTFQYPTHQNTSSYQRVNIVTLSEPKPEVVETRVLTDEDLGRLYSCKEDIHHDTTLDLAIEDAELLMQIARAEGGETLEGQEWVMAVILNRLNDGRFGDSIYEIVSAPLQFEVFSSGSYKKADVNANSHLALAEIEQGWNETNGALYFESCSNSSESWHKNSRHFIREVEGNRYYR